MNLEEHAEANAPYRRPLKVLVYDIETSPIEARIWRPNMKFVPANMIKDDYFVLSWAAKWWGQDKPTMFGRVTVNEANDRDDQRIVKKLGALMLEADVLVAHYGNRFDWPKINGRLLYHGLEPLGKKTKIDTKNLSSRHFGFSHNSLDYLGKILGEGQKIPTTWDLWERCLDGPNQAQALKEMDLYCRQDVELLSRVFTRFLPYVDGVARLFDAVEWREDICPYCGSSQSVRRGFYRTQGGTYPRFQCKGQFPNGSKCGKFRRGRGSVGDRTIATMPL